MKAAQNEVWNAVSVGDSKSKNFPKFHHLLLLFF